MTIDEMIAVLQAAKEGKTIECKRKGVVGIDWGVARSPIWDFLTFDYRVKPEPVELEAWFFNGKYQFSTLGMSELDKNFYLQSGYKYKKMREVIE